MSACVLAGSAAVRLAGPDRAAYRADCPCRAAATGATADATRYSRYCRHRRRNNGLVTREV